MPEMRGLAATLYGGLPLFSLLIAKTPVVSALHPMLPDKIKFVIKPHSVQSVRSGIFFEIPELLFSEMDILEKAILSTFLTAEKHTVLDVPESIARKFSKKRRKHVLLNELLYKNNKLVYSDRVVGVLTKNIQPVDIFDNDVFVADVPYISFLLQAYYGIACNLGTEEPLKFLSSLANYNSKNRPTIGIQDKAISLLCTNDLYFKSQSPSFLFDLCNLLCDFYSPYTDIRSMFAIE